MPQDAGDPELETILAGSLIPGPAGKAKSALRHLQENLFRTDPSKAALDDSVTCLGVRDSLEAAEIAAGMIQKALDGDSRLRTSEIGLLLPGDGSCEDAVREVFSRAGLPVSGLEGSPRLRNLGGEAVFLFLATRRRPAPVMALAALYSSPLMPWDAAVGNRLAMRIMNGKFRPEAPAEMPSEGRRMMDLLREEHDAPRSLAEALKTFGSLLTGVRSDGSACRGGTRRPRIPRGSDPADQGKRCPLGGAHLPRSAGSGSFRRRPRVDARRCGALPRGGGALAACPDSLRPRFFGGAVPGRTGSFPGLRSTGHGGAESGSRIRPRNAGGGDGAAAGPFPSAVGRDRRARRLPGPFAGRDGGGSRSIGNHHLHVPSL